MSVHDNWRCKTGIVCFQPPPSLNFPFGPWIIAYETISLNYDLRVLRPFQSAYPTEIYYFVCRHSNRKRDAQDIVHFVLLVRFKCTILFLLIKVSEYTPCKFVIHSSKYEVFIVLFELCYFDYNSVILRRRIFEKCTVEAPRNTD